MKILALPKTKYKTKDFRGRGKHLSLIYYKDKIVLSKALTRHVINWYHTMLCHPGLNRTEETISQHLWWPEMRKDIRKVCSKCSICQRTKRDPRKLGHLPPKQAEAIPWDKMYIDLIGPYTIRRKVPSDLKGRFVTMIDPATGWLEIH